MPSLYLLATAKHFVWCHKKRVLRKKRGHCGSVVLVVTTPASASRASALRATSRVGVTFTRPQHASPLLPDQPSAAWTRSGTGGRDSPATSDSRPPDATACPSRETA